MPRFLKSIASLLPGRKALGMIRSSLQEEKLKWGAHDFLSAEQTSLYLSRAIAKRAEKVGEVEFVLQTLAGKEIESDPMLQLLYKPNSYMSGPEFWSLYQRYKDLAGAVYVWKEAPATLGSKVPAALHFLRPDLTKPVVKDGGIVAFEYTKPSGGTMTFQPDEIFYSYYPDPLNMFFGLPLVKAGARAIDTEMQIASYHSKVLRNGGRVDGVFQFKTERLSKEQLGELKDGYKKEYASAAKAGMPLFLGGDATYTRMGLTPEELGFETAKRMTLEDICILTGVPKSMLGSTADVKFDNADAERAIFLRETIKPLLANLTHKLNEFMFPPQQVLTFVDPTPENITQQINLAQAAYASDCSSVNERREMLGLDRVAEQGADEIMVSFTKVPLAEAAGAAAPGQQNAYRNGVSRRQLKKMRAAAVPAPARKAQEPAAHPLRDAFVRKRYGQLRALRMERMERTFAQAVGKMWKAQEKRLTVALGGDGSKSGKGGRKKSLLDSMFDKTLEVQVTRTALLPLIRQLLEQGGNDAMQFAGDEDSAYALSVDMEAWVDARASVLGRELTDTTFEALKAAFTESDGENENRQQLVKRIQSVYDGFTGPRAATIARTEVHGAYQQGTVDGYKQAGASIKIWVAVADEHTRASHLAADGQEVPIDQPFNVGGESLMFPGDPAGSAEETINCRCTI